MKIRTGELTGPALDWAVAKAVGKEISMTHSFGSHTHYRRAPWCDRLRKPWEPSTNWSQGGPLISEYNVSFEAVTLHEGPIAEVNDFNLLLIGPSHHGETHLIAAMRAIVAYKIGDEVEIPEELLI